MASNAPACRQQLAMRRLDLGQPADLEAAAAAAAVAAAPAAAVAAAPAAAVCERAGMAGNK
jgi:hypothetical protein